METQNFKMRGVCLIFCMEIFQRVSNMYSDRILCILLVRVAKLETSPQWKTGVSRFSSCYLHSFGKKCDNLILF